MQNIHRLIIHNLGPILNCELVCSQFMVLTGEQASGKSTIAKALYYFRTVKDDLYDAIQAKTADGFNDSLLPFGRSGSDKDKNKPLIKQLRETLRIKFLRTFGYPVKELRRGMRIKYYYTPSCHITVRLLIARSQSERESFILNVALSDELTNLINEYDGYITSGAVNQTKNLYERIQADLNKKFNDGHETIYIPSGRSMLTLLSNYMHPYYFLGNAQVNNIDYCTQKYIDRLMNIKSAFSEGADGLIDYNRKGSNISQSWEMAREFIDKVLCGSYKIDNGEERIILKDGGYVKINFASSGQQDALWITNLLFYYLVQNRPAMFIIEEPESHLFPSSQKYIMELISLVCNQGHSVLVTTHSPYVLGTLNNLLYASSFKKSAKREKASKIIPTPLWLEHNRFQAWFVRGGIIEDGMDHEIKLIDNERIDEISRTINDEYNGLFELEYDGENDNAAR